MRREIRNTCRLLPVHDPAAVDVDGLAGDGGGVVGGEAGDCGGDLLGGLPLAEGAHLADFGEAPFVVVELFVGGLFFVPGLPDAAVKGRLDHAGADRVDADAVGSEVFGGAHCEVD